LFLSFSFGKEKRKHDDVLFKLMLPNDEGQEKGNERRKQEVEEERLHLNFLLLLPHYYYY